MVCGVTGIPASVISYYFNATLITTGVSNGALTIASVTHANTGLYQCFADNVRPIRSPLWIVTVRNPGECDIRYSSDVTLRSQAVYSRVRVFNSRACSRAMLSSEPKEHFWL